MIVGAFIFGLAFGFYGFAWLTAPERARARRRMERLQLRADVSVAATAAMRQERDEAVYQYERGVDAIIDRIRAAVDEEDGLVLDWLDENTGWSA